MPSQLPGPTDSILVRETLRGVRHVLRQASATFRETVHPNVLPPPAARVAGVALREFGALSKGVDGIASDLGKRLLGGKPQPLPSFEALSRSRNPDIAFAAVLYAALGKVLSRIGAPTLFVSEAAARDAYARAAGPDEPDTSLAARMTLALVEAKVIRGASAAPIHNLSPGDIESVAIFAVMLWLLSQRSGAEDEDALHAAADVSIALGEDVARACAGKDVRAIEDLLVQFASHV